MQGCSVDETYPGLTMSICFMLGSRQAQGESGTLLLRKKTGATDQKEDSQGVQLWYPKCWDPTMGLISLVREAEGKGIVAWLNVSPVWQVTMCCLS